MTDHQQRQETSIRAAIFDMGGVLLRTEDQSSRIELAKKYDISVADLSHQVFDTELAIQAGLGQVEEDLVWQGIAAHFNLSPADALQFQEAFWKGDVLDRDLVDFIGSLRPRFKTGLLSNAWSGARAMLGGKYQALHVFDVAVFSAEVGMAKPDGKIFDFILQKLEVRPEEAVFVDDFPKNIEGARQCGLHTVWFRERNQALRELKTILGLTGE